MTINNQIQSLTALQVSMLGRPWWLLAISNILWNGQIHILLWYAHACIYDHMDLNTNVKLCLQNCDLQKCFPWISTSSAMSINGVSILFILRSHTHTGASEKPGVSSRHDIKSTVLVWNPILFSRLFWARFVNQCRYALGTLMCKKW